MCSRVFTAAATFPQEANRRRLQAPALSVGPWCEPCPPPGGGGRTGLPFPLAVGQPSRARKARHVLCGPTAEAPRTRRVAFLLRPSAGTDLRRAPRRAA